LRWTRQAALEIAFGLSTILKSQISYLKFVDSRAPKCEIFLPGFQVYPSQKQHTLTASLSGFEEAFSDNQTSIALD